MQFGKQLCLVLVPQYRTHPTTSTIPTTKIKLKVPKRLWSCRYCTAVRIVDNGPGRRRTLPIWLSVHRKNYVPWYVVVVSSDTIVSNTCLKAPTYVSLRTGSQHLPSQLTRSCTITSESGKKLATYTTPNCRHKKRRRTDDNTAAEEEEQDDVIILPPKKKNKIMMTMMMKMVSVLMMTEMKVRFYHLPKHRLHCYGYRYPPTWLHKDWTSST